MPISFAEPVISLVFEIFVQLLAIKQITNHERCSPMAVTAAMRTLEC